jgi:FtsP/CotA-like multicopper oxidase with cupredoxin domain
MVITRRGMARPDGSPRDVDREFATLFMIIDENTSHYLEQNIDANIQDPKSVNKLDMVPVDLVTADMVPDRVGTWMFHCHIDEHMEGGMMAMYRVLS